MAGPFCVSFRAHERKWAASVFEDRVKKDTETAREFDVVARVAEPCCSQGLGGCSLRQESRLDNWDSWRGRVRRIQLS
jgi:hypothetical protein